VNWRSREVDPGDHDRLHGSRSVEPSRGERGKKGVQARGRLGGFGEQALELVHHEQQPGAGRAARECHVHGRFELAGFLEPIAQPAPVLAPGIRVAAAVLGGGDQRPGDQFVRGVVPPMRNASGDVAARRAELADQPRVHQRGLPDARGAEDGDDGGALAVYQVEQASGLQLPAEEYRGVALGERRQAPVGVGDGARRDLRALGRDGAVT